MQSKSTTQFTLIELVLVMMLMTVLLAIAAPRLSGFVRGRALKEEGRRFVALARLAASEAVSRGEVMELWIDAETMDYGLQVQADFPGTNYTPRSFHLHEGLLVEVPPSNPELTSLLFHPDGEIELGDAEEIVFVNRYDKDDLQRLIYDTKNQSFSFLKKLEKRE